MEEAQLIKKAMLGDARSLEKLIDLYYNAIHAFCCRRMGNPTLGIDACQETFLKMVQNLPRYRERGYFKSWLYAIASNCCNDAFRRQKPTLELNVEVEDQCKPFERTAENAMLLQQALGQLPEDQREVVILRYYHDFSTKDVARMQRIPTATVKTRLHRALKKLQKILGEDILLET